MADIYNLHRTGEEIETLLSKVANAAITPSGDALITRDTNGRAQVTNGSSGNDIATINNLNTYLSGYVSNNTFTAYQTTVTESFAALSTQYMTASTSANIIYGTNDSGNRAFFVYSSSLRAGSIPIRDSQNRFQVGSPAGTSDAANKGYVDSVRDGVMSSLPTGGTLPSIQSRLKKQYYYMPAGPSDATPTSGEVCYGDAVYGYKTGFPWALNTPIYFTNTQDDYWYRALNFASGATGGHIQFSLQSSNYTPITYDWTWEGENITLTSEDGTSWTTPSNGSFRNNVLFGMSGAPDAGRVTFLSNTLFVDTPITGSVRQAELCYWKDISTDYEIERTLKQIQNSLDAHAAHTVEITYTDGTVESIHILTREV